MDRVSVFLDESGNANPKDPLVICGIAIEAGRVRDLEERILLAHRRVLAKPRFRDGADRERFEASGFHRSLDLPEVGIEFSRVLTSTNIYKALLIATDRSTLKKADGVSAMGEVDQMVELYVRLGGVVRRQFRQAPGVDLVVERNEPLLARLDEIRDRINSRRNAHGRHLPLVTVEQTDKAPSSVLGAADALAHIAAGWIKTEFSTNREAHQYRSYLESEAALSWFCSLEHGVISTRRTRHSELLFEGTGAESVPLASPHASASELLLSTRSRAPQAVPRDIVSNLESFATHLHTEVDDLLLFADEVSAGNHFSVKHVRAGRKRPRQILRPNLEYGTVSKELSRLLLATTRYETPPHVFGFIRGRSIRDNAKAHLDRDCVLRLDIQRFFESIAEPRLLDVLRADGLAEDVCKVVVKLSAPQGRLGTGLSTSPHLSNLAFQQTDEALLQMSASLGLTFTRYVDDLTFSGVIDDVTADELREVISKHGWEINEHKTRFMRRGHAQYVTGLSVSDRATPHAPRQLKRAMRWRLHIIETRGYDEYMTRFDGTELGHYPSHLRGMARYLVAQEPGLGPAYLKRWDDALPTSWFEDEHAEYIYAGDGDLW